jgi:serine/threonine protein kinase
MAEVFRAVAGGSAGFVKQVAVKRILSHLAQDASAVRLLIDEARIAATLSHPHILQVLDLGEEQGTHFIVMEYVAGRSLAKVVEAACTKSMPLPVGFSLHVVAHALRGLAFAHQKRDAHGRPMEIIHRDVSPQNVMIGFDGTVKLADFGIARAAERTSQTEPDTLRGKPAYMSPEQVNQKTYDQRVDTYAIGVVLHELLAGRRMRVGTSMQLLIEVSHGKVTTFEELGVMVSPPLAETVYRALAYQPDDRWPSAEAFAQTLDLHAHQLGEVWSTGQVAQLMRSLFSNEIEQEARAEERALRALKESDGAEGRLDRGHPAVAENTPSTPFRSPLNRRAGPPLVVASGVFMAGVLAAVSVVWWALMPVPESQPRASTREPAVGSAGAAAAEPASVSASAPMGATPRAPPAEDKGTPPAGPPQPALPHKVELLWVSQPAGALVFVNGQERGVTPMAGSFEIGSTLEVRVTKAGFKPVSRSVLVPDKAQEQVFALVADQPAVEKRPQHVEKKLHTGDKKPGSLTLRSTPWARIFVDGKDTGRYTFVADMVVPAGRHVIRLLNEEHGVSATFTIDVAPGERLVLNKELK